MRKGRIFYEIFLIIILFLFLFFHDYYALLFFIAFMILPLFSYIMTRYVGNRIELKVDIHQSSVWAKNQVDVIFKVNNPTIFPLAREDIHFFVENEFYENDIEQIMTLPLRGKSSREYQWGISSDYCGKLSIRLVEGVIYDPLNLFVFKKTLDCYKSVMVLPLVSQVIMDIFANDVGLGEDENPSVVRGEDVSEVLDVREYVPGDKESRIHWKLSIKAEEWMVKVYPYLLSKEIVLLVDLYQSKQELGFFDELMTAFYSTALELIDQEMVFSLCYYQINTGELCFYKVTSKEDLSIALESLYLMKPYSGDFLAYNKFIEEQKNIQSTTVYFSDAVFCNTHDLEPLFTFEDKVVVSCI